MQRFSRVSIPLIIAGLMAAGGTSLTAADSIYYADIFNPDPTYGSIRLLTPGQSEP